MDTTMPTLVQHLLQRFREHAAGPQGSRGPQVPPEDAFAAFCDEEMGRNPVATLAYTAAGPAAVLADRTQVLLGGPAAPLEVNDWFRSIDADASGGRAPQPHRDRSGPAVMM